MECRPSRRDRRLDQELAPPDGPFGDLVTDHVLRREFRKARRHCRRAPPALGIDPIPSMAGLLEDKGIRVVETNLPERFDGLACDVLGGGDRPATAVVVVSRRTGIERKRFTLAHELAHRVVCATGNPEIQLENAIDRFAGAFLVPAAHLAEEAGAHRRGLTYHELMRLKHRHGVAAAAMLLRLGQGGILPQSAQRLRLSQRCARLA